MWLFLREATKNFITQGSLFPSSPFLTKKMVEPVEMRSGVVIVELGAGSGVFTKELLMRLPADGRLVVFEINPVLMQVLKNKYDDSRVVFIEGDARHTTKYLKENDISHVDYVVSGLPIGNFNQELRQAILDEIQKIIGEKGVYIQFQYFLASWFYIRRMFDARIKAYELRNVPPAFVYVCKNTTKR